MTILLVLLTIVVFFGIFYATAFNKLIHARQKVKEAWSGIDVQLKRRYDLIPKLVETVKGYATHEQNTLTKVIAARTAAMDVPEGNIATQAKAENMLSSTLKSIFALSENYPDLKANQNFIQLQEQLVETEDQISASRRIYNGNVTILNTKVQGFPSNFVANLHKFNEEEFFELDENTRESLQEAPKVTF
ncbi:LemA family protein [Candidatus Gracilibacteria bacterium]|nr:LemA family protein [Candidatus Gracilibacteria bacterium]